MTSTDPRDGQACIEIRFLTGDIKPFSVPEYVAAFRTARGLSNPKALSFHGVYWTVDAPPPEGLTIDWQKPGCEEFRISEWDTYCWQMDRLLGLR